MERHLQRMSLNERMDRAERQIKQLQMIDSAVMDWLSRDGKRLVLRKGKLVRESFEPVELEEMSNGQ